jgi:hypothetical protein
MSREMKAASLLAAAVVAGYAPGVPARSELASQLPIMTPRIVDWAEDHAAGVLRSGSVAPAELQALARKVGVREPSRIRIAVVDRIPLPEDGALKLAAGQVGLSQSSAAGMTLGYAVIIHRGYERDLRLLSHEFRHVAQYEESGGIRAFLAIHLPHLLQFGYEDSPFEVDARAHEARGQP